jgi:hypothetical protein
MNQEFRSSGVAGVAGVLDSGFWILDSGFWILDSGFWILDSGFWILDSGIERKWLRNQALIPTFF